MAEEEKKEDTNDSFFGSFNNKYIRGGAAALIAAYAAKEDPYLLQGFAEGIEERQKADREARNALIKASTETHLRLQSENRKRRLQRRNEVEPKIKQAKELGINPYVAGKAYKSGTLDTLINLKITNPDYDVNSVYEISEQNKDKISGLTHSQIIESLVGPTQKLDEMFSNIKAPKRTNFIRNFIEGTDEDTSIVSDVKRIVSAQDMSKDDSGYVDVDYGGIKPTPKGQEVISKFLSKDEKTKTQTERDLKNFTSSFMNIELKYDRATGENVFSSDDINNVKYANLVTKHFVNEVESMVKDPNSPAFRNREVALSLINNKYLEYNDETGLREIRFDKINEQYDNPIIPEGWTPSTTDKKQIEAAKKAKETGGDAGDKKVTTSGNKTTQERINELIKKYEKKKKDLLKEYNGNINNSSYQNKLRIAGNKIRNNIKDLGGTGSEIPYATK